MSSPYTLATEALKDDSGYTPRDKEMIRRLTPLAREVDLSCGERHFVLTTVGTRHGSVQAADRLDYSELDEESRNMVFSMMIVGCVFESMDSAIRITDHTQEVPTESATRDEEDNSVLPVGPPPLTARADPRHLRNFYALAHSTEGAVRLQFALEACIESMRADPSKTKFLFQAPVTSKYQQDDSEPEDGDENGRPVAGSGR
jgi:hypothetical protein